MRSSEPSHGVAAPFPLPGIITSLLPSPPWPPHIRLLLPTTYLATLTPPVPPAMHNDLQVKQVFLLLPLPPPSLSVSLVSSFMLCLIDSLLIAVDLNLRYLFTPFSSMDLALLLLSSSVPH